ncbi:MAG: hypothetical protein QNJ19_17260 [Woeseiaceae bacterium]|nr:hypothetical protein [Woeseiaceae bacterium]
MFRNKHMILAFLIAPVLAIIAWFSVDYFVAERPHSAKPGASYELIAKPNCRRYSQRCDLKNEDVELSISVPAYDASGIDVELDSTIVIDRAAVGLADGAPAALTIVDADGKRWVGRVAGSVDSASTLRIAVIASESTFYAEVPTVFFIAE